MYIHIQVVYLKTLDSNLLNLILGSNLYFQVFTKFYKNKAIKSSPLKMSTFVHRTP